MKKLVATAIVITALTALGMALAQPAAAGQGEAEATASHMVEISIPSLLMIRFTADVLSTEVLNGQPDPVQFIWGTADFEPVGVFSPTNSPNWGDIKVFANGNWSLSVEVSNGDFAWSQVSVIGADGDVRFSLPASDAAGATSVLAGQSRTIGWYSLGIAPEDYRLELLGNEEVNSYATLVSYTISNP